jgi:hypothetical protein
MTILAAAAASAPHSTMDRLQQIPLEFWLKIGLGIVALVVLVVVLRKVAKVNKMVLGIIVVLILSFVGFNWIYERNEPTWATPAVQWLAGFFPSKGKIEQKKSGN